MFQRIAMTAAVGLCCVCARAEANDYPSLTSNVHEEAPAQPPKPSPATEAANKKLQERIADVRFSDVGLGDAIDQLRDLSGLNIFVNWKSLEKVGLNRTARVSLHLKDKRLSTVIDLLLTVAATEGEKLGYLVEDGVVSISTEDDLAKNTLTRVYDVRDLLAAAPPGATRDVQVAAVVKLIMDEVASDSWRDRGGKIGAIRELQGQLIVTQTPDNHTRIVSLLDHVRPLLHGAGGK
ncbi:MAG: pilQ 1 [Phycisphaerales bacterium]|nr:pilQ 1 [Phycisphaerales bacterium]